MVIRGILGRVQYRHDCNIGSTRINQYILTHIIHGMYKCITDSYSPDFVRTYIKASSEYLVVFRLYIYVYK